MRTAIWLGVVIMATASGYGQEPGAAPKKAGELLPPPRLKEDTLPPPQMFLPPDNLLAPYSPPHYPRWGTRDVWQFYGVDGAGRFRPRVVLSPYGAYYAINGAEYPWTTTRPMLFMPYIVD